MRDVRVPAELFDSFGHEFHCFKDCATRGVNLDLLRYAVWLRQKIGADLALLSLLHDRKVTVTRFDRKNPGRSTLDSTGDL